MLLVRVNCKANLGKKRDPLSIFHKKDNLGTMKLLIRVIAEVVTDFF